MRPLFPAIYERLIDEEGVDLAMGAHGTNSTRPIL